MTPKGTGVEQIPCKNISYLKKRKKLRKQFLDSISDNSPWMIAPSNTLQTTSVQNIS